MSEISIEGLDGKFVFGVEEKENLVFVEAENQAGRAFSANFSLEEVDKQTEGRIDKDVAVKILKDALNVDASEDEDHLDVLGAFVSEEAALGQDISDSKTSFSEKNPCLAITIKFKGVYTTETFFYALQLDENGGTGQVSSHEVRRLRQLLEKSDAQVAELKNRVSQLESQFDSKVEKIVKEVTTKLLASASSEEKQAPSPEATSNTKPNFHFLALHLCKAVEPATPLRWTIVSEHNPEAALSLGKKSETIIVNKAGFLRLTGQLTTSGDVKLNMYRDNHVVSRYRSDYQAVSISEKLGGTGAYEQRSVCWMDTAKAASKYDLRFEIAPKDVAQGNFSELFVEWTEL